MKKLDVLCCRYKLLVPILLYSYLLRLEFCKRISKTKILGAMFEIKYLLKLIWVLFHTQKKKKQQPVCIINYFILLWNVYCRNRRQTNTQEMWERYKLQNNNTLGA